MASSTYSITSNMSNTSSTSITSSTGNTRNNKVALTPGHSLLDWIKLGNSGKDLTSVGGLQKEVTEEELAVHSGTENAWIGLQGKVYNVAPYMDFHPGGVPELLRGVGKDATKLFNEVHPWVNFDSILRKCFVGRLIRNKTMATAEDFEKAFFKNIKSFGSEEHSGNFDDGCKDESVFESDIKMCWCQTTDTIKFVFQCKISSPQIVISLKPEYRLRILIKIKKKLYVHGFKMEKKVIWPCHVSVNSDTGRIEVEFTKKEEGFWTTYGINDKDHATIAPSVDEIDAYHKAKIISINQVTHNVRIFVFKFVEKVVFWVPIGHDIRIRGIIQGIDYAKQYTPIPPYLPHGNHQTEHWHHDYICCLVKHYSGGALTPYLFSKKEQDVVEIGGISGSFNLRKLSHIQELYLIAAGSGLSPMLRLIVWAVSKKDQVKKMKLLFVNRLEQDIIWKKELDDLSKKEKWFKVIYCLSQPSAQWQGLAGRIDDTKLNEFLPNKVDDLKSRPEFFICACGPIKFSEMIQKYLDKKGYESCSHCFIG